MPPAIDTDDLVVIGLAIAGLYLIVRSQPAAAAEFAASSPAMSPAMTPAMTPAPSPAFSPAAPSTAADIMDSILPMSVSDAGAAAIAQREGFSADAYADAGGQSIGYGHKIQPGDNITPPITQDQAWQLLQNDVEIAAAVINDSVTVPLTQNQFDALASLVYNIGEGNFARSELLAALNQGDYAAAAVEFSRNNPNPQLAARRTDEAAQFETG